MEHNIKVIIKYMGLALFAMFMSGCFLVKAPSGGTVSVASPDMFGIGEEIAIQLTSNLRKSLGGERRLLLTTLVDLDDLYVTTRFGRTLTEAMSTRLFRMGYGVQEVRKVPHLMVKKNGGELILSRDVGRIAAEQDVEAIVAGTYSLTPETVIINVRMLAAGSQEVLSVAGLELERSYLINTLLAEDGKMVDGKLSAYEL